MITERDIQQATMYIDGVDIYNVGALVESFKVSGTAIENTAYQGVDSTNFNVLSTVRGMRTITVTLFYKGKTNRELALKKTKIDNALGAGKIDLALPDGFKYFAYLTGVGEESVLGVEGQDVIALSTYKLQGIRHDDLETIRNLRHGITFQCKSLAPLTDYIIDFVALYAMSSLTINGMVFTDMNIPQFGQFSIDGINKRFINTGQPYTGKVNFKNFPKLKPGDNQIPCDDTSLYFTVRYYPIY